MTKQERIRKIQNKISRMELKKKVIDARIAEQRLRLSIIESNGNEEEDDVLPGQMGMFDDTDNV